MSSVITIADLGRLDTSHVIHSRARDYSRYLDVMPPVVVFRTPQGLILADGFRRVAAALLLGRTTIDADLREGTRADALEFAVESAVAQGVSPRDARAAITRRRWAD